MKPALILTLALLGVPNPAFAQPVHSQLVEPDTAELRTFKAAIRKLYDLKERDFAQGRDDHILGRFYAPDAVSFGEGEGISTGREDFRKIYDEVTRQSNVKVRSIHTWVSGNAGWDWANFYVTPKDPKDKPFSFAILFLWAKEHGHWICKGDAYVKGAFPVPAGG
jgi:ketosteroid isomerase-like protein